MLAKNFMRKLTLSFLEEITDGIVGGFHLFEGTWEDTSGLINPVYEYDHSIGRSVTGGFVYRGIYCHQSMESMYLLILSLAGSKH